MLHKNIRVFDLIKTTVIVVLVFFCLFTRGYAQTKDVNTLIKELKSKDADVRYKATRELGNLKDVKAVEPLIGALKDTDRFVRREAAWVLGEIKENRAVEPLITALKDNDPDVRIKVVQALVKIGDASIESLIIALKDTDRNVRIYAIKALGKIMSTRVIAPLMDTLNEDADIIIQVEASNVLGELLDSGNPLLSNAVRDFAKKHGYKIEYEYYKLHPEYFDCKHTVRGDAKLVPRSSQGEK